MFRAPPLVGGHETLLVWRSNFVESDKYKQFFSEV